tara:strand:- start:3 stop:749 length:747 start_codon:yes stop_codon:yes gene_type:complete
VSDARLRELEQAWRASGQTEDHLAFLAEQARSGALDLERIRLAAYCGHGVAREFLRSEAPEIPTWTGRRGARGLDFRAWLSGLRHYPQEASLRVGLALAYQRVSSWAERRVAGQALSDLVFAIEDWIVAAGAEGPVEEDVWDMWAALSGLPNGDVHEDVDPCVWATASAAIAAKVHQDPSRKLLGRLAAASLLGLGDGPLAAELLEGRADPCAPPVSVEREVGAWALDIDDVLRRRAEVRQGRRPSSS